MRSWILTFGVLAVGALPAAAGTPCAAVATFGDRDGAICVRRHSPALDALESMAVGGGDAASRRFDGDAEHRGGAGSHPELRPVFFGGPPPALYTPPMMLPPNALAPSLGDAASISAPTPQAAPVAAAPAPARVASPVAAPAARVPASSSPNGGSAMTPCGDLRDKARRLRSAADQCDSDVANGAPYCSVTPTFARPSLPRSLSADSARSYADEFDRIADEHDETSCSNQGGDGVIPAVHPPLGTMERVEDFFDMSANGQVIGALIVWASGVASKLYYGPEASWTRALQNHSYLTGVRDGLRRRYAEYGVTSGHEAYNLTKVPIKSSLLLMLRDALAPVFGFNMAYTTGSMTFDWVVVDSDERERKLTVEFTAKDRLRLGSLTRDPRNNHEYLEDDALGRRGPFHTLPIEWHWTEVIDY